MDKYMKKEMMKLIGTAAVLGTLIIGFTLSSSFAVAADKYPTRPVTIIVPFQAGGTSDLYVRLLAQHLPKYLGQNVIIENHPGSGAVEGTVVAANANPDGYTVLSSLAMALYSAYYMLPGATEPSKLEAVAQVTVTPYLLAVSEKSGFKSLQEMVAFAKKNPRKLLVGINIGAGSHLMTVTIMKTLGIEPKYVPFKGGAERGIALAGGHLDVSVDSVGSLRPYMDAGKARALGIGTRKRSEMSKEIPTFVEQGWNLEFYAAAGYFVPKGTPDDVIQTLGTAIEKSSKEKTFIEQLEKNAQEVVFLNRQDYKKSVIKEGEEIKQLIEELGLSKPKK